MFIIYFSHLFFGFGNKCKYWATLNLDLKDEFEIHSTYALFSSAWTKHWTDLLTVNCEQDKFNQTDAYLHIQYYGAILAFNDSKMSVFLAAKCSTSPVSY